MRAFILAIGIVASLGASSARAELANSGYLQAAAMANMVSGGNYTGAFGAMMMMQQSANQASAKQNSKSSEKAKEEDNTPKVPFPTALNQLPQQIIPDSPKDTNLISGSGSSGGSGSGGDGALGALQQYQDQFLETEKKIRESDRKFARDEVVALTSESAAEVTKFIQDTKQKITSFNATAAAPDAISVTRDAHKPAADGAEKAVSGTIGDKLGASSASSLGRTGPIADPIGYSLDKETKPSKISDALGGTKPQDKLVSAGRARESDPRDPPTRKSEPHDPPAAPRNTERSK